MVPAINAELLGKKADARPSPSPSPSPPLQGEMSVGSTQITEDKVTTTKKKKRKHEAIAQQAETEEELRKANEERKQLAEALRLQQANDAAFKADLERKAMEMIQKAQAEVSSARWSFQIQNV